MFKLTCLVLAALAVLIALGCEAGPQGPQGETGPQGDRGSQVEAPEVVLFPAVVLDFTISDRCAAHILESVSYSGGTEREIAAQQEELRRQLQLPTRFMWTAYSDAHNWRGEIERGLNLNTNDPVPACSDDAERWAAFHSARYGPLWVWRDTAFLQWSNCVAYDYDPPPTPDARREGECAVLRAWIPETWLPPVERE